MKYTSTFVLFSTLYVAYVAAAGNIQLQPTPGILIPAAALRFARSAYGGPSASTYSSPAPAPAATYSAPAPAATYSAPAPAKSSYGSSSSATIKAPPCPKNYMFSCQPSLTPVPCAAPTQSYSSGSPQGSYSHSYPLYAAPQYGGYPQYAVPIVRELY